jgi:hypothetical protein
VRSFDKDFERASFWQIVFSQSRVNGAPYSGEQLPSSNWQWPRDTFLQRKLRQSHWDEELEKTHSN